MWQDIRYALRLLRLNRGLVATASSRWRSARDLPARRAAGIDPMNALRQE
jgi:hypothetical protein